MRKRLSLTCLLLIVAAAFTSTFAPRHGSAEEQRSAVVAETARDKIGQAELDAQLFRKMGFELKHLNRKEQHALRRKVLAEMVDRALLLDAAREAGFVPGETSETENREQQEDRAIAAYLDAQVFSGIQVSDEELASQTGDVRRTAEERQLREIFFEIKPGLSAAEQTAINDKALSLSTAAKNQPERFADLARRHSDHPDKGRRGSFGFVTANQLEPELSKAAFSLTEGSVSSPIRTSNGLHIIKVERVRLGREIPEAEQREMIKARLLEQKKRAALARHLEELKKQSKVIIYLN